MSSTSPTSSWWEGPAARTRAVAGRLRCSAPPALASSTVGCDIPPETLTLSSPSPARAAGLVLGLAERLAHEAFHGAELLVIPEEARHGGNALAVGLEVILGTGYPFITRTLEQQGFTVHAIDMSEFEKADAGPTCLALFVPA